MSRMKLWLSITLVIVAAAVLATFLVPGAGHAPPPPSEPPVAGADREPSDPSPRWAGSERCRSCHEDIFELYEPSHHAHADRLVDPVLDRGAFDPPREVTIKSTTWRLRLENGQPIVIVDEKGHETRKYRPQRVIGHTPLWQLLIPGEGGRLQTTSLAYDPEKHDWFDVYGDQDRITGEWGHWLGRGMTWNTMCASCHMTNLHKGYDPATDTYDTRWVEPTVGCESCHGPYAEHADWHETPGHENQPWPGRPYTTVDTIFDTCGSCHARRGELTPAYVPGEPFTDHFRPTLPDEPSIYYPDGQVLEEDYVYVSFLSSRMYGEGVRCQACHDPHSEKLLFPGNDMCLNCHKEKIDPATHSAHKLDDEGGKCINCHMPLTTYMGRDPRRDHGMTIPDPLLTRELGIPNACSKCHTEETLDWAIQKTDEMFGEKMERNTRWRARTVAKGQSGDEDAIDDLIEIVATDRSPVWRAVGALLLRRWVHLAPVRKKFVEWLGDPEPLVRSAAVRAFELLPDGAAQVRHLVNDESRLVRIDAAWALRRSIDMSSPVGKELAVYLDQSSDQPTGALQRGVFYFDRGDATQAETWMRKAVAWDSNASLIRHSLAVVLATQGKQQEATDQLRHAVRLEPENADHAFSLALALAESDRPSEARAEFERACKLDPTFARAWYNLGLLHAAEDDTMSALTALERAEREDPAQPEYPYATATVHARQGDLDAARAATRRSLRLMPDFTPALELLQALDDPRFSP